MTLTGDITNKTFVEVPTNTSIRQVLNDFGGGVAGGKKFKAVQIGGTSADLSPKRSWTPS